MWPTRIQQLFVSCAEAGGIGAMRQEARVVVAGTYLGSAVDIALLRSVRGSLFSKLDRRFFIVAILSVALHGILVYIIKNKHLDPPSVMVIEEMPERFARLIIEKPMPKKNVVSKTSTETVPGSESEKSETKQASTTNAPPTTTQKKAARKAVDAQVARVENKIRTVGVLGMLTGVGTTAKGPTVVDVLGTMEKRRNNQIDLEAALDKMTGLQKTKHVDVLNSKLVKSKEVAISHKESIDDLLAHVDQAKTIDLAKRGSFIIQKPQSIEGAASSDTKRDFDAISAIVSSHKTSIRMSYEKYLKRDPTLAGKITIRFTIAASGSVTMVTIIENSTGNSDLEDEITRKIRMWRFEPIPEGDVTVTYPFVFSSAG